jgi:hypothetical protein
MKFWLCILLLVVGSCLILKLMTCQNIILLLLVYKIIWMADVYLCLSIITFDQKVIEKYMVKRIGLSNNNSSSIALFIHLNVNIFP